MSIRVNNIYTGSSEIYSGTPEQIRSKLYLDHPEFAKFGPIDIDRLVEIMNSRDSFIATKEFSKAEYWLPYSDQVSRLSGALIRLEKSISDRDSLRAAIETAEDPARAVLIAAGIEPTEELVKYVGYYETPEDPPEVPEPGTEVKGLLPEDCEIAQIIQTNIRLGRIDPIDLGGKHSRGSMVTSGDSGTWLLKASSNGQSPAGGISDQTAPPTRREGAYYRCAQAMGVSEIMPTHVISIGSTEYAAMHLLDREWMPAKDMFRLDHGGLTRILNMRLLDCYKWAFMDFVLGDPDRHGGNIMMKGTEIVLLDHGASFAGDDFSPGDLNTFVPFYLRVQIQNYESKTPEERIQTVPRLSRAENEALQKWISGIGPEKLKEVMTRFGITPDSVLKRLHSLVMTSGFMAPDLSIADAWLQT